MSAGHRFAPPWFVEERDGCFVVRDGNGRALSRVYFKNVQEPAIGHHTIHAQ